MVEILFIKNEKSFSKHNAKYTIHSMYKENLIDVADIRCNDL